MPERISLVLDYLKHPALEAMSATDRELLELAHAAALRAYAPYSKFLVGAALRMADGTVVTGNNQENASYPAGICAERTALHAAMSQKHDGVIVEMAIVVPSVTDHRPVSPCGICRQALVEQECRQHKPMRLLLSVPNGPVYEMSSAAGLMPLSFDASFLGA